MIRRLVREESGMTMGLTVMMMVLVGVMGAGLLTFVQKDLSAVLESNRGQTALNLADAGAQTAKRHLLLDANVFRYDGTTGNGESPWACVPDANNVCTSTSGKVIDLGAGTGTSTRVWIKYLLPATTSAQMSDPNYAPELVPVGKTNYEFGRDFFKVISEGTAGNAKRKVEAIYQTYDLGTPRAYFAQGNIWIRGTANISGISVFSLGNIELFGSTADKVTGEDLAYGNWLNSPFNTTARSTTGAGIGAVGLITPASRMQAGPPRQDFDSTTTPQFIKKVPPDASQTTSKISFPFNYERQPDIGMMRQAAQLQSNGAGGDNYYEVTGTTANLEEGVGAGPRWPANSDISTVVFVKFTNAATINSNLLTWVVDNPSYSDECAAGSTLAPPAKGTLVVENGNFRTQSQTLPLRGTVVVKGSAPGVGTSGTGLFSYQDTGNACMQSFAHASGDIDIGGNPGAFTEERGNRPGFFGVRLWGWRECYSATCTS